MLGARVCARASPEARKRLSRRRRRRRHSPVLMGWVLKRAQDKSQVSLNCVCLSSSLSSISRVCVIS